MNQNQEQNQEPSETLSAQPSPPEKTETAKKIIIAAIGGCGAKTLNAFAALPGSDGFDTLLLETDREAAEHCRAGQILRAEANWAADTGLGCGGDPLKGERAFARERAKLTRLISGHDFVIVTGGLGGGTATGGVRTAASVIRNLGIPAVFLLSTPFSFESYTRRTRAEQCLLDLRDVTEVLVPLPNDLLFSTLPPDTGAEAAFAKASEELAASIFGVAELFRGKRLIGPDYAEFAAILGKETNTCAFGVGRAASEDGLDRCSLALERMLESPFLGGMDRLCSCGSLLVTMTGGDDLQLAEMKRTLENLASLLPAGVRVSAGGSIHPEYHGKVQLSALAVHYTQTRDPERKIRTGDSLWNAGTVSAKENKNSFEQGLLNLQSYSKGIFSNCAPVKYKDEDLDVPTFQRRGIVIDKGSTSK